MTARSDLDSWLAVIKDGGILPERTLRVLCEKIKEILIEESNVQPVSAPVTICGDIHGHFHDLLKLFEEGGEIPDTRYIFMGNLVNRGYNSVETFQLLLCLKLKYPNCVTLMRGNHETRNVSQFKGLYEEIMRKYGNVNPWKYCTEVFDYLCIGAIIEGRIFCVHAGLSPEIKTLDQISLIDRVMDVPHEGPFCDFVWSDPEDIDTWAISPSGAGWLFGSKVTTEFNRINNFNLIARSHQLVNDGYKYWFRDSNLVTVWSAPNYCYRLGNVASILNIDENLERQFKIFEASDDQSRELPYSKVFPYFM